MYGSGAILSKIKKFAYNESSSPVSLKLIVDDRISIEQGISVFLNLEAFISECFIATYETLFLEVFLVFYRNL